MGTDFGRGTDPVHGLIPRRSATTGRARRLGRIKPAQAVVEDTDEFEPVELRDRPHFRYMVVP